MKKNEDNHSDQKILEVLSDDHLADRAVLWIHNHQKKLWISLSAATIFAMIIATITFYNSRNAHRDFAQAEHYYTQWITGGSDAAKSYEDLIAVLNRHPELKPLYQGRICQILLDQSFVTQAIPQGNETLSRVSPLLPKHYLQFSKTTLLISQTNYQKALDDSLTLQSQLTDNSPLKAYNQIRIAMLYKELGNKDKELEAWTLVEKIHTPTILENFEEGTVNLADFIAARRNELMSTIPKQVQNFGS